MEEFLAVGLATHWTHLLVGERLGRLVCQVDVHGGDQSGTSRSEFVPVRTLSGEVFTDEREVVVEPAGVVDAHRPPEFREGEGFVCLGERPDDPHARLVAQHVERVARFR